MTVKSTRIYCAYFNFYRIMKESASVLKEMLAIIFFGPFNPAAQAF